MAVKIFLGSDHVGVDLKETLKKHLAQSNCVVEDCGVFSTERMDYPEVAKKVSLQVTEDSNNRGILVCGTGVGMAITANKVLGVRAVVCSEPYSAKMSRSHNDTNILCLGARVVGVEIAEMIVSMWLFTEFEGGRHRKRIDMICKLEGQAMPATKANVT